MLSELSLQIMTLVSVIVGVGVIKLHSQSCSQMEVLWSGYGTIIQGLTIP